MALIKSALEVAMERIESVPADPQGLLRADLHKKGARLAVTALQEEGMDLNAALSKFPAEEQESVREGLLKVLLARIVLPKAEAQIENLVALKAAFVSLKEECAPLLDKVIEISQQYVLQKDKVKKQLDEHFLPLMRQKEAQISEKTGRKVRLSAENVPEIQAAYKEQMHAFEDHYHSALDQLRWTLSQLLQPQH